MYALVSVIAIVGYTYFTIQDRKEANHKKASAK